MSKKTIFTVEDLILKKRGIFFAKHLRGYQAKKVFATVSIILPIEWRL